MDKGKGIDRYLALLMLLAAFFVLYWTAYGVYRYRSFENKFWDAGQEIYSMYLHLHYSSIISGLQFLSFSNHISFFKLLLLPIFALYQSPLTLYFLQDLSLGIAAIIAYFIGKDIAGNRQFGFALGLAFLLSPGIRGIVFYDLHVEAFIPLFYLLAFYFYMKNKKGYFIASYVLMLSTIETSIAVGITFLLGLLFYELVYVRNKTTKTLSKNNKLRLIAAAFIITMALAIFYQYTITTLLSLYRAGAYPSIPPSIKVLNFASMQTQALIHLNLVQYSPILIVASLIFGFFILFLGFGITNLRSIILTLILVSPWIVETLVLHNYTFGTLNNHYYSYVIGGAIVAATLGYIIISKEKRTILNISGQKLLRIAPALIIVLSMIISIVFIAGLPFPTALFIPTNWKTAANYSSIQDALAAIPSNSSVLAQPSISAHLYNVLYIELPPDYIVSGFTQSGFSSLNITTFYNTKPQYVVFDSQLPDFDYLNNTYFNVYDYMGGNYSVYKSMGGFKIYKRISG
jgi:uncharacterized membrane protein